MRILLHWLISAICIVLICWFVPGFHVTNLVTAFIAAAVIGLLNAALGALLKIISLPLEISSDLSLTDYLPSYRLG